MKRLDFSVLLGWAIGLAAIAGCAMLEGIRLRFLWQPTAALVVFGGTLGAVLVRCGSDSLRDAMRATFALFFRENNEEMEAESARLAWLARTAHREGARVFEAQAESSQDPLLREAFSMMADYAEPRDVLDKLHRILDEEAERGLGEVATLDAAGGYAPTFGIIGAVLGLIFVLRSIADPAALGAGIATAFVATIYGVGAANLLFFPLAARLRERHRLRLKRRGLLVEALVALAARESPGVIAARLAT
ncbi:MAG: MotA/TolQ/ExbB proton channel family protein [Blastocatellia bacterium]|nr:MotA/TolQ/ExbB proton channel family protein [Blastocatellia bacterium]